MNQIEARRVVALYVSNLVEQDQFIGLHEIFGDEDNLQLMVDFKYKLADELAKRGKHASSENKAALKRYFGKGFKTD